MEVNKVIKLEEMETKDNNGVLKLKTECEGCARCFEFQEQIKKANESYVLLGLELKQRNDELRKSLRNGTQLTIENNGWKAKCRELEKVVMELKKRLMLSSGLNTKTSLFSPAEYENTANEDEDASGTPPTINTPFQQQHIDAEGELKPSSRKCLKFSTEGSSYNKNISPLTPGVRPRFGFPRERKDETKWECYDDMLDDLAKSPQMCMKAVSALYRQQTPDEKSCRSTIHCNGRGFSQDDALRGSELAEFMTDRDAKGDVKKTEGELQEFNSSGIEQCRIMAKRYSNQLFAIYENDEDHFFHPQEEEI